MPPPAVTDSSAREILPLPAVRIPMPAPAGSDAAQQTRPISLRRNFAWTLAGNLAFAGCQWGILIVLAKLGTPVMVGQFARGLALTAPIFMFSNLQLRSVQATDSRREFCFADYLGLRLAASVLALGVVLGIAWCSGYRQETVWVVMMVGIAKCFESISDIFYGLYQQHERFDRIAKSLALNGCLALAGMTLGVFLTGSLWWGAFGFSVTRLLMILFYDIPSGAAILRAGSPRVAETWKSRMAAGVQAVRPTGDLSRLLRLALLGLPLGGTTLLVSLHSNFPRYFIAEEYELGIFSAIAALMTAGTMVFRALDQSSSPRLARLSHAGDSRSFRQLFIKVMLLYVGFGLLGILAAAVAGEWLLALMFQPEYAAYPDVLLWVMVAACLSYIMGALMTAMIAARKLRPLFPMLCLTATASLIFCWWLVPLFGMTGAAQAIALSKLPFVMIGFVVVWRMTRPSAESPQCGSALDPISEAPAEGRPQRCAG